MRKKIIITGIICCFLLAAGVCYSCSYRENQASGVLVTSLTDSKEGQTGDKEDQTAINLQSSGGVSAVKQKTYEQENSVEQSPTTFPEASETENLENMTSENDRSENITLEAKSEVVYVHICGAVNKPGVYPCKDGERLIDLIMLAGGLNKKAAGDYINQAQAVADGQRIYIPTKDEVNKLSTAEYILGDQSDPDVKMINKTEGSVDDNIAAFKIIDINTADAEELMSLPGIGEAKADNIIEYRSSNGKFNTIEELMNIPGIKEGLFQKVSSYIAVK